MFGLLLLLFLTSVSHVQPNYRNRGYSKRLGVNPYNPYNPYYGWNKKPARQMNVYGYAKEPQSNWFHDMGEDWAVSNKFSSVNPFYNWYKKAAKQMDLYGPAKHVGKIYRGQFLNPELNTPSDRAFGYQSDFNPSDLSSGVFKYKPKGQKFRATAVHVNEGLASYVGEVRTMPIGQHVQEDGSILVQTDYKKADPCNPNPCTNVRMSACTVVNKFTAKCSRSKTYKLTLTWDSVDYDDYEDNDLDLQLVAARHDGTVCEGQSDGDYLNHDFEDCGVLFSEDDYADYEDGNSAEEYATLTTLPDGTKYQDYTYAVIAYKKDPHNLSEGGPTLTVEYDGAVIQTLAIPQYSLGGVNVNWDHDVGRYYYFFGCFRPQFGFVDTRGAGYYYADTHVIGDKDIHDVGLCKELLDWTDAAGFNPHDQSGSGSGEVFSWRDLIE